MSKLMMALGTMALLIARQPPAQPEQWRGVPLDLPLLDGGRLRSDTVVGRVVVLNLWASWCAPCRAELPALDSLRRELAERNVLVVFINKDRLLEDVQAYLEREGFDFPTAIGGVYRHERYGVRGLPTTILLAPNGREQRRWLGYAGPQQIADIREASLKLQQDSGR